MSTMAIEHSSHIHQLLGSAIGLSLLIPAIPLWGSVLITSVDVIFVLAMAPTSSGRPVRAFEVRLDYLNYRFNIVIDPLISCC